MGCWLTPKLEALLIGTEQLLKILLVLIFAAVVFAKDCCKHLVVRDDLFTARSLSEKSERSREQIKRRLAIMLYAKGLPTLFARSRLAVAAEPARMDGGRASGVLRE